VGVIEKLPGGARQDKAAVRVSRLGGAFGEAGLPRRSVETILPMQFIREREGVARELEPPGQCFRVGRQISFCWAVVVGMIKSLVLKPTDALRT